MTMTSLVSVLAKSCEMSQDRAREILDVLLEEIKDQLLHDNEVRLPNFGKFYTYQSKPRKIGNPHNGGVLQTPSRKRIRFKAFDSFKKVVNSND